MATPVAKRARVVVDYTVEDLLAPPKFEVLVTKDELKALDEQAASSSTTAPPPAPARKTLPRGMAPQIPCTHCNVIGALMSDQCMFSTCGTCCKQVGFVRDGVLCTFHRDRNVREKGLKRDQKGGRSSSAWERGGGESWSASSWGSDSWVANDWKSM